VCFITAHMLIKLFTALSLHLATPSSNTHRSSSSHLRGYSSSEDNDDHLTATRTRIQQRPSRCSLTSILSQGGLRTCFRMMISGIQRRNFAYIFIQNFVCGPLLTVVECKSRRGTLFGSRSNNNDRDGSSGLVDTPSNSDRYY